jgi:hypothetical protein
MIEELSIKLKSRKSDTKEPVDYEVRFIVKKDNLKEVMNIFTKLLSFEHLAELDELSSKQNGEDTVSQFAHDLMNTEGDKDEN